MTAGGFVALRGLCCVRDTDPSCVCPVPPPAALEQLPRVGWVQPLLWGSLVPSSQSLVLDLQSLVPQTPALSPDPSPCFLIPVPVPQTPSLVPIPIPDVLLLPAPIPVGAPLAPASVSPATVPVTPPGHPASARPCSAPASPPLPCPVIPDVRDTPSPGALAPPAHTVEPSPVGGQFGVMVALGTVPMSPSPPWGWQHVGPAGVGDTSVSPVGTGTVTGPGGGESGPVWGWGTPGPHLLVPTAPRDHSGLWCQPSVLPGTCPSQGGPVPGTDVAPSPWP